MDIVAPFILLGICLALIFGLPFGIARYCYNFLKKKNVPLYWRWVVLIPALAALYFLSAALLPDRHIYELDYFEIMAYRPPESASFFYGEADKMGRHAGDYSFGITVFPENYKAVFDILHRRGFAKDTVSAIPDTIQSYLAANKVSVLQQLSLTRYSHYNYYAEMLSDSSTIFMRRIPK